MPSRGRFDYRVEDRSRLGVPSTGLDATGPEGLG